MGEFRAGFANRHSPSAAWFADALAPNLEILPLERVGVRQCGDRSCLALEACDALRIGGEGRREHFDRDLAPKARVARAIDLAHSARTERSDDLIRAESCSSCQRHWRRANLTARSAF